MINIDIKFDKEYYGVYGKEFGRSIFDFQVSPKIDIEELAEGNQDITLNFPDTTKYYSFSFMLGLFNPLIKITRYKGFCKNIQFSGQRGMMLKETALIACLNDRKD